MTALPEVEIGSVCTLVNGYAFKPSDWSTSGLPIVRIQNLNDPDRSFNYFKGTIKEKYYIDSGELLFSWSGTPGTSFGSFFWHRGEAVVNQHIFRVLVDFSQVDKDYFRYALNYRLDMIIAQSHGGVGLKHITKGKLEATKVPLPPLAEQKRIAAILDKADTIRCKRKKAISLTEEFLRSAFLDMFGDPVTNPKEWEVKTLEDCCIKKAGIKAGPFGSSLKKEIYTEDGYRIYGQEQVIAGSLNVGNYYINKAKYESLKTCAIQSNDILISLVGSIGKTLIVPHEFELGIINPRLIRIRTQPDLLHPVYLQNVFKQHTLQSELTKSSHGGTMPVLNATMLKQLEFAVPPKNLQDKFACLVARTIQTVSRVEDSFFITENLFNSLVQQAFRGELTG